MASKTTICNMALAHLGQGLQITNIDTEKSEAAQACRIFFDVALEAILRKRDWSFARKTQALSYVGPDATGVWGAVFRYPPDCLMIRSSGYPSQPTGYPARFALGADDQGTLIYAVDKSSFFTYTYRNFSTETYPADFTLALSYLLAWHISPRIAGAAGQSLAQAAYQSYEMMVNQAAVNSFNEEGPKNQTSSAFQDIRNS